MTAPIFAQAAGSGFGGGSLLLIAVAIILWVLARMLLRVKGDVRKLRSEIAALGSLKSEIAELRDLRSDLAVLKDLRAEIEALKSRPAPQPVAAPAPATAPAAPAAPAPAAPKPADELTPEMFSAIIAAVAYTLGNTHEIVSISSADSLVWSREGRRNIFSSHSPR